jgi:hypothetical protein
MHTENISMVFWWLKTGKILFERNGFYARQQCKTLAVLVFFLIELSDLD